MGGAIVTPVFESFSIFSRAIEDSGDSLGASISFFPSFSATAAHLVVRVSDIPWAIFESVFILQGATITISAPYEPEEGGASRASFEKWGISYLNTFFAPSDMTSETSAALESSS